MGLGCLGLGFPSSHRDEGNPGCRRPKEGGEPLPLGLARARRAFREGAGFSPGHRGEPGCRAESGGKGYAERSPGRALGWEGLRQG